MDDRKFVLEFIDVYQSLPALWQIKSQAYSNKHEKNKQYEILLEKYKEKNPNAVKKDVAQKINSLRTAYRKELKRISTLERSGAGVEEDSQPTLYYFDALQFLRDNEQPCASQSSMDYDSATVICEEPRKRKRQDAAEELMLVAAKRLQQPPEENKGITDSWACKFNKMSDTQKVYADKFISEILFEGQLGTLHRNSMQLNIATPQYSSSTTPTFVYNSNGSLTRCSTPRIRVPVPLISPQISDTQTEPTSMQDASADNSLTHYFSSFE